MDTMRGVESFVRSVELGSLAAASRRLGISAAAVSQNIARLESALATRLLTRTTRSLALTDSGEVYYQRVKGLLQEMELAAEAVSLVDGKVSGRLKIACSAAFARHVLAPLLPMFYEQYPELSIELMASDRHVDHRQEGIDVSIRIREQLDDSLVANRLTTVPLVYCASPDYLDKNGVPDSIAELRQHRCLLFKIPVDEKIVGWSFIRHGERFQPEVRTAMICDDIDMLANITVAGGGIARLAAFVATPYIAEGRLIPLFEAGNHSELHGEAEPLDYYFCVADRFAKTLKVRVFQDFLHQNLPNSWDKGE
ncbi:LysR family transcriptional regulator [Methylophaga thalassica]|uniref:LysR family transcriptional regulator n=1 Tax=Methylophaga thalassica TaxID=40223 RepID=A0ABQ5TYF1_9GAMM|nr:LysR family transcriptional regulator [Methylophaga thalassica]GLQ00748.1 LysR family transcriptional regulator [Methylophaga thalassica]